MGADLVEAAGSHASRQRIERALKHSWIVVFAHAREDQLPSAKKQALPQQNAGAYTVRFPTPSEALPS